VTLCSHRGGAASWATHEITSSTLAPNGCVPPDLPSEPGKLCGTVTTRPSRFYAVEDWRRQPLNRALSQGARASEEAREPGVPVGPRLAIRSTRGGKLLRIETRRETRLTTAAEAARLAAGSLRSDQPISGARSAPGAASGPRAGSSRSASCPCRPGSSRPGAACRGRGISARAAGRRRSLASR
jgi:hypothetical protein